MTASIIAALQLTESVVGYVNTIRNASADQRNIAIEASNLYGLLTSLRFRVEAARSEGPWYLQVKKLGEKNGPLDQFRSALESLAARTQPTTGASKAARALKWKFDKAQVQETLTKTERLKTLVSIAPQNDLFALSQAIHGDLCAVTLVVSQVAAGMSQLQLTQADENQEKIYRWLDAPDPSSSHNAACEGKQAGTGAWFLQSEQFMSWKSDPSSLLWADGIPGCGKTVLCSTIIQDLLQRYHEDVKSSVAYFYFDFNDAAKRQHGKLFRSLLIQLSRQKPEGLRKLEQLYQHCERGQIQPTDNALVVILRQLLAGPDHVYVVLDALDECQSQDQLMGFIRKITEWHLRSLHLLVTSRKEKDIEDALEVLVTGEVCIQSAVVDLDIQIHIRERLQHDPKLKKWPPTVQLEIEEVLMQGAHGMFRWVICQLESIRKCIRLDGVRRTLACLPQSLNETYAKILLSIEEDYRHDAHRVLQWLCFSARPLRLAEMVEVLAINLSGEPGFAPEHRLPDARHIVTICSSLVNIVPLVTRRPGGDQMNSEVRLAHLSVKEYLLSAQLPATVAPYFNLCAGQAHANIAQASLLYLVHLCSETRLTQTTLNDHPLAHYAAERWTFHMTVDEGAYMPEILNFLGLELLASKPENLSTWLQFFDPDTPQGHIFLKGQWTKGALPLYYSSLTGLAGITRVLLESGVGVNAQGGRRGNALQAASSQGYEKIVKLLLSEGANVNAQGGLDSNALHAASSAGHVKIVELLLNKSADISAQDGLHRTALLAASSAGHEEIVELLLSKGADVSAQDIIGRNALHKASSAGREKMVELLLRKGADINAHAAFHGTALRVASFGGHKNIVELLLCKGADVNAHNAFNGTALQAASLRGHEKIVELLLSKGADVNDQFRVYYHAVKTVSLYGNKETVESRLSKGTDIEQ